MPDRALLSAKELGQYLGISVSTVYRQAAKKEIPHIRRNGIGLRFQKADIDEWLGEGSYKAPSDRREVRRLQRAILNTPLYGDIRPLGGASEMPKKGKIKSRLNLGYGAVYPRKTKQGIVRWYLDYRDGRGERVQKVAPEAITAKDAIHALKKEVLKVLNEKCNPGVKRIRFSDFSDLYLQNYIMVKRRNWASDKFRLNALRDYFKENQDLRDITPMAIQGLIKTRQEAGNADSTINRYLALLKHLMNRALEEGYLESNPAKKVKPFRETSRMERVLSKDEEARLFANCSGYLRSALIIALNTGARIGEILRLEWRHVDLEARKISLVQTKSGKPRVIFINTPLLHELGRMKSENGNSPYLFYNEQTWRPLGRVSKAFITACRKAAVKNFRIHDCRHTFISRLLAKGADVETVRSLAGHSSLSMVQRYAHSQDVAKKNAVELLSESPGKDPEMGAILLHICDTAQSAQGRGIPAISKNRLVSWN